MRTSHSRRLSYGHDYATGDTEEILAEEMWTGPQVPPKPDVPSKIEERPNRTFFGNFSSWRPSPSSASRPTEQRPGHYQTVSSSLAQRRATVDLSIPPSVAPLPELPRRYSENASTLANLPRAPLRMGGIKRKPVPVFAVEDDVDTVEDPHWNGKADTTGRSFATDLEHNFEERVRSLSLEEIFDGETGLGFLVQKVEPFHRGKRPLGQVGRSHSTQSTATTESRRSSTSEKDSRSAEFHSFHPLPTLPYSSDLSSLDSSSRSSSPHPFETANKSRPFALVRRRQSRPLEAHGSIIPSLATRTHASRKEEEDLMDAWMEIMVGKEEEPNKEERPALVFQSRPRKTSNADRSYQRDLIRPRTESVASIASNLPPLRYSGSTTSRRSSVVSLPPLDLSEAWAHPFGVDAREESEDGSEEFHDAKSWSSDHGAASFPVLDPVPESPLPSLSPPACSSASTSTRFSPLFAKTRRPDEYRLSTTTTTKTPAQTFADQLVQASTLVVAPSINNVANHNNAATKRRHSRSLSLDFLSNTLLVPPRPPKSARRLSKPNHPFETTNPLVAV